MRALGQFLKRAESCSKLIYSTDPRPVPLAQLRGDTLRRDGWGTVKLVLLKIVERLSFSFEEVSTFSYINPLAFLGQLHNLSNSKFMHSALMSDMKI